jgi:ABC-type uncharacterized transport system ATPase subunit
MKEILRMEKISKIYSNGVIANHEVDFSVHLGEIHAIAGENGAGKSTIMKILFGLEKPTSGKIYLNDEPVTIGSPIDALKFNIGMVHQHFMLVDNLTVAENIFLGMEPIKRGVLDYSTIVNKTIEVANKYQMEIDPHSKVGDLSVSQKQKVEILKVLVRGAKIIILDEPTAVLTPQETVELFHQLKLLKEDNCSIIIITHKLNEIKEICDRVTILRQGKSQGVFNIKDIDIEELSRLMVGNDVSLTVNKAPAKIKEKALEVKNLVISNKRDLVKDVSFDLYKGEILCIAGVEGNGQQDAIKALTGLNPHYDGEINILNQNIKKLNVKEIRDLGVAHIPEDRMTLGVAINESILDNLISTKINDKVNSRFGFVKYKKIKEEAEETLRGLNIKYDSIMQPLKMLSGGNMQKVVIGRELSRNPEVLICDQPTRGVDVGAIEFIHNKLIELRDAGKAILLVSADLSEVFNLADRIIVFYDGKISAHITDVKNLTEEELGLYMLGLKTKEEGVTNHV